jgi:hypothetical protein
MSFPWSYDPIEKGFSSRLRIVSADVVIDRFA